jgi:uncharacterized protein (TIGR02145 family)
MKKITIIIVPLIAVLAFQLNAQINLNLKVFLEGPFNGTTMNTSLNVQNLIPLAQPYLPEPWNYSGTEQVGSIPNPDIVDWVLVELRETTGDASTATPDKMIDRQAAFIKADGSIVGTNGSSMITYSGSVTNNLYVIIWHRNHLAIMSSGPMTNSGGIYSWDFTDQFSKAYLDGQKQIATGIFGMIAGDSDASGTIYDADIDPEWSQDAGKQGYYGSDLNLDSQVNNPDKNNFWDSNYGMTTKVPRQFLCGTELFDNRDNQVYTTISIGSQCWMAENLNIGTMIPGASNMANNSIIEKYCYYNNSVNCDTYGGLYQWNEMMQYSTMPAVQGICPEGWHVPTNMEWTILTSSLGGESIAGGKMKTTGTLEAGTGLWNAPNAGATDESGFSALPGGDREYDGSFSYLNYYAHFWSSTEFSIYGSWYRHLLYNYEYVGVYDIDKNYGYSVRCVTSVEVPALPSDQQSSTGAIDIQKGK